MNNQGFLMLVNSIRSFFNKVSCKVIGLVPEEFLHSAQLNSFTAIVMIVFIVNLAQWPHNAFNLILSSFDSL